MLYEDIDLLDTRELLALPPTQWLLSPLIPKEGFVGLYGPPSSGKSFIALDWAMCVAQGKPWLGQYPVQQCPVVYVAAEGGRGIQQRVKAWMDYYSYADLPGMYYLLSPLYVREEGTVEAFLSILEAEDIWPGLIVLDTLSRSFGGGEENASADMGHFVDQMTKLALGRRMAALIVHHTNAQGQRERGSTAFRGAADAMFACSAEKDKNSGRITRIELKNDKQKDGEEAAAIYVRPVLGKFSLILEQTDAPPVKERHDGTGPAPMRKIDMLTLLGTHEHGLTFTEWRLACGIPRRTFARRVGQLIGDGEIAKENGYYTVIPSVVDLAEIDRDTE